MRGRFASPRFNNRPISKSWSTDQSCPNNRTSENRMKPLSERLSINSFTSLEWCSTAFGYTSPSEYSFLTSKTLCDQPRLSHAAAMARPQWPPPAISMCGTGSKTSRETVTRPPQRLLSAVASWPFASRCKTYVSTLLAPDSLVNI